MAPGGRYAAVTGRGAPWLCVLDLTTGQCHYRFDPEGAAFGQKLSADGAVLVWHTRKGEEITVHVRRHGAEKELVLRNLPRRVRLRRAAGVTGTTARSSPFEVDAVTLLPGGSVSFLLQFSNPAHKSLRFTPEVYAGPGSI